MNDEIYQFEDIISLSLSHRAFMYVKQKIEKEQKEESHQVRPGRAIQVKNLIISISCVPLLANKVNSHR